MPKHLAAILLLTTSAFAGNCVPFEQAREKLGEIACVKGRVLKVASTESGTWFLNFCEDYRSCPFSVVTFARDLRDVGDIRTLEGKDIEINGKVKDYKGQTEIILRDRSQLRGPYAKVPKLPKDFDSARRGSYSAGTFKAPRRPTASSEEKRRKPSDRRNPDREDETE